ncbi:hypothetical protein Vretimale_12286 [Volvox reticuliferus]|uniref:Uncharacterized protein n=1 Tax=Volvox reticuliferus TaxID=1737510 RepID=A0A8J4CDI4_9CHLO|nr:hypothetical protein Vretifemale_8905 [Volvox reticuliferus]GIM08201.1 hypothetical protein Vretimale_12286 [Volvox reticuliferus]
MQRSRHPLDEQEKDAFLMEPTPDTLQLKLQLQDDLEREREAASLSARRAFACRVVAVGFTILFIMLFCFKAVSESADQRRSFSSSCMHAVGGGIVGPRGSLLHFDPRCTEELKEYFDQAYYAEVRRVSDEAIAYFRQLVARHQQQEATGAAMPSSSRGTVIFDIDETALSNMDGFFGGSPWSRLFGRESPDRCVRPHLEYDKLEPLRLKVIGDTGQLAPVQPQRRPLCYAPPLRATLDLYNYLYDNNFTVIFLTGRSEDARSETEANLADAGYGRKCGVVGQPMNANSAATGVSTTAGGFAPFGTFAHRRGLRQAQYGAGSSAGTNADGWTTNSANPTDPMTDVALGLASDKVGAASSTAATSDASSAATTTTVAITSSSSALSSGLPFAGLFSPPSAPAQRCYTGLLMREVGDERLASVFKAEARARLVAVGHVLVGNIGDQFSDLVGQASAVVNFKLPNPVYTLL